MDIKKIEQKLLNPRPGSKAAAAKEFGIDLTLLISRLRLTPEERLAALSSFVDFIQEVRRQNPVLQKAKRLKDETI